MERMRAEHGDVVTLVDGATPYLFAFGEASNRTVLGDPGTFHNLEPADTPLRVIANSALSRLYNGLIQLNGPTHKRQRKVMAQAMNRMWREENLEEMAAIVRRRVAAWPAGGTVDLAAECREITLQLALKVLLGVDAESADRTIACAIDQWARLVFSPLVFLIPLDLAGLPYARLQRLSEHIETAIRRILAARRAAGRPATDVLGGLLDEASADGVADEALIGQTNFLFMASHLTTASAMAWTLFCVMAHPSLIEALVSESASLKLSELLSPSGEMSLAEAVIRESLRLFPPVVWWMRIARADFALGGYACRAGTRIIHSPYVSHRDPVHFTDPYGFRPQRWFSSKPGPFVFCPFSAGPRMCLGERMAMAEIRLLLKYVLERFTPAFRPDARVDVGGLMLSTPSPGLFASLMPAGLDARAVPFSGTVHTAFRYDCGCDSGLT